MEELKEMATLDYKHILQMILTIIDNCNDKEEIKKAIENLLKQA